MKVGAFMKFELNEYHRNTSDEELIEDLKRVAKLLQKDSVTIDDYNQYGQFHATTLTRRFKSWFCCLEKAELKMSRSLLNISDEDLFEEIERVWVCIGKQPSYAQMRDSSKYSVGTYEKRFGGWRASLESFINYINCIDENLQEATDLFKYVIFKDYDYYEYMLEDKGIKDYLNTEYFQKLEKELGKV